MGWDYHHVFTPINRKAVCRSHVSDRYEVIKDAVVGTTWYAALKNKETREVHATVVLTHIDRNSDYNFGMKWTSEDMGPIECDCPASILNLLSPTCDTFAMEWRERCRARIIEKKAKNKDAMKKAPYGTRLEVTLIGGQVRLVTKMAPNRQFKTFWLLTEDRCHYVPKRRVKSARVA